MPPENGMLFVDILTNLERVSDHAINILYAPKESADDQGITPSDRTSGGVTIKVEAPARL